MNFVIDIILKLVSHMPKLVSWWLYSPKRTKENVEVSISATEGSVEIWCDKYQAMFNVVVEFKNNNPFPIEIDRVELRGQLNAASMKALEIFGAKVEPNSKIQFYPRGRLDEATLEQINKAADDATLRLEVRVVIINKYHYIRDFTCTFDRLMCKFYNKTKKTA